MTAIVQPPPLGSSSAKRVICECCFITLCTSALSLPVPMPCTMNIEEPLGLLAMASSMTDATSSARMPLMSLQPADAHSSLQLGMMECTGFTPEGARLPGHMQISS